MEDTDQHHMRSREMETADVVIAIAVGLAIPLIARLFRGGHRRSVPTAPVVTISEAADGNWQVTPFTLPLPTQNTFALQIVWKLAAANAHFADDGIVFENPGSPPQFTRLTRVNPTQFSCVAINRGHPGEAFYYTINLMRGTRRIPIDPWVKNGPTSMD